MYITHSGVTCQIKLLILVFRKAIILWHYTGEKTSNGHTNFPIGNMACLSLEFDKFDDALIKVEKEVLLYEEKVSPVLTLKNITKLQ